MPTPVYTNEPSAIVFHRLSPTDTIVCPCHSNGVGFGGGGGGGGGLNAHVLPSKIGAAVAGGNGAAGVQFSTTAVYELPGNTPLNVPVADVTESSAVTGATLLGKPGKFWSVGCPDNVYDVAVGCSAVQPLMVTSATTGVAPLLTARTVNRPPLAPVAPVGSRAAMTSRPSGKDQSKPSWTTATT